METTERILESDTRDSVISSCVRQIIKRRGLSLVHPAPLMFALDHPNYARWLPMHICDIMLLEACHTDVAAEFKKGNFCS